MAPPRKRRKGDDGTEPGSLAEASAAEVSRLLSRRPKSQRASPARRAKAPSTTCGAPARDEEKAERNDIDSEEDDWQDVVEADDTTPHREASISGEIVIGSHKARKARYADRFFADMVHRACLLCLTGRGIAVDKASMQGDIPERAAKALAISGMGFDSGVDASLTTPTQAELHETVKQMRQSCTGGCAGRSPKKYEKPLREASRHALMSLEQGKPLNEEELSFLFASALRFIGWLARLVLVLDPGPRRPTGETLTRSENFGVKAMMKGGIEAAIRGALRGSVMKALRRVIKEHDGSPHASEDSTVRAEERKEQRNDGKPSSNAWAKYSNGDSFESLRGPMAWVEVFSRDKTGCERWIPVDVTEGVIDKAEQFEGKRTFRYVFAFNCGSCKDVTSRYAWQWSESVRQRVNQEWLRNSLRAFVQREKFVFPRPGFKPLVQDKDLFRRNLQKAHARVTDEDVDLEAKTLTEKVPMKPSKLKDHPRYALEKFLGRNQAIHPRNPKLVAGFVEGQPVWPRGCVREVYTEDKWLKDFERKVREEEKDKPVRTIESPSEGSSKQQPRTFKLYGEWQTEPYERPMVKDGVIPKNSRGNVDMLHFSRPPPGSVHVTGSRIASAAKSLGIDYADALVGFERRQGKSHPQFSGIVVCREHQELLLTKHVEMERQRDLKRRRQEEANAAMRWRMLLASIWKRRRLHEQYEMEAKGGDNRNDEPTTYFSSEAKERHHVDRAVASWEQIEGSSSEGESNSP